MAHKALSLILTASYLWCLCQSQRPQEDLPLAEEIKVLSQRLTEMENRMTSGFAQLQGAMELIQNQLTQLQGSSTSSSSSSSSKQDDLLHTFKEILQLERDFVRETLSTTCTQDQMTAVRKELDSMNERIGQCSSSTMVSDLKELVETNFKRLRRPEYPAITQAVEGCSSAKQVSEFQELAMEAIVCVAPSYFFPNLGCITPVTEAMSWRNAKENCQRQGTQLLQGITTSNELMQLVVRFRELFAPRYNSYRAWLDIRGGKWVETNESVDDSLWAPGEPLLGRYGCGYVYLNNTPSLLAQSCSAYYYRSLCQKKVPTVWKREDDDVEGSTERPA